MSRLSVMTRTQRLLVVLVAIVAVASRVAYGITCSHNPRWWCF